jgi:glutathione S-transferase
VARELSYPSSGAPTQSAGIEAAYLRYKEIPFERIEPSWRRIQTELLPHTGMPKVPLVQTPDGQWLQDTTPMIDWFEARFPEPPVVPADPLQSFAARLLEDYADEWLWRPALHYRWSYPEDARHLSQRIVAEGLFDVPLPRWLLRFYIRRRQRRTYVIGDGVDAATRAHVENTYLGTLDRLEENLAERPFLLGQRPCLADFGFFASMFRHFSLDPTPARIMRQRAPAVFAWVARLWNARARGTDAGWLAAGTLPDAWHGLLRDAAETYLPYLHANAMAWHEGKARLDYGVQGVSYRNVPAVHYRVWCRERLQDHFEALPSRSQPAVRALLEECGAWEPLWRGGRIRSGLHEGGEPPLCRPARRLRERLAALRQPWNPAPTSRRRRTS